MSEDTYLIVGAWYQWQMYPHDKDFQQFFHEYGKEDTCLISGKITAINLDDITLEVHWYTGGTFIVTYSKEYLYNRGTHSLGRSELRKHVEAMKWRQREARKERKKLIDARNQADKTPYSVYHISCEGVVLYVGIAKDMQTRFKQHLKNDAWIQERVQAGKEVIVTEICPAIGILDARQREREWVLHYHAISPLYNKELKPPDLEQKAKWEAERKAMKAEWRAQRKAMERASRERWREANNALTETLMQLHLLRKQWEEENNQP